MVTDRLIAQLVKRKDYKLGYQVRVSIVFYQKIIHRDFLLWLKSQLNYGYIRDRNDGMSEYVIVGLKSVEYVILQICPYLQLKNLYTKS